MKRRVWLLCLGVMALGAVVSPAASGEEPAASGERRIALTFDKLPFMEPLGFWRPRELSRSVLRALEARDIRAIGFVVEEKIDARPDSYVVLLDWVEQGQYLGNNTYNYIDLNEVSVRDFLALVADGGKYWRRAARETRQPRFFRYPMLHEGNSEDKKREVSRRLYGAGFVAVPATVVVTDYEFNHFFDEVADDEAAREQLRALYLETVLDAVEYAEQQSRLVFGREIPQILRLHMGQSAAHFLTALLERLEERGYRFITPSEALEDEAYQSEETYAGPLGLGFIDRVAATRGLEFDPVRGRIPRGEIGRRLGLR